MKENFKGFDWEGIAISSSVLLLLLAILGAL
jgi:hypothetical protein